MCYKIEKHKQINVKLSEKLEDVPSFISDFFDRYKSSATKNCNWVYIKDLLEWLMLKKYIKKKKISEITPQDINEIKSKHIIKYLNELKNGTYKRVNTISSICTKKNVFSAFWNYLMLDKYVDENIIRHIPSKLFKSEDTQKEVYVPTDEQVNNFLDRLNSANTHNDFTKIRNITIVKLFIGSGIRSEELINLDIKDLHLNETPSYIMVLGKGKMEKYDKVYISDYAKESLVEYLEYRKNFVKDNKIKDNALFLSNDNRRISKASITKFFDKYSDGQIYPHALRHLVGTKLYEKTKDIAWVQKQLRHSSVETAMKYYVRIDENDFGNTISNML